MKKYAALLALAGIILAAGCTSSDTSSASIALDPSETEIAALEPDIAFLTREAPSELETPPQELVTYSGNGLASAAVMTLGSYTWSYQGEDTASCSAGPLTAYADGLITAVVDLDLVSENEPKIQLSGAELTGAQFYPLDESESCALDYTPDGSISFPDEAYSGVAVVSLSFPQGNADYYFAVTRSQTEPSQPPELYLYLSDTDIGLRLTKCVYTWTVEENGEALTASVDCATPWRLAQENKLLTASAGKSPENRTAGERANNLSGQIPFRGRDRAAGVLRQHDNRCGKRSVPHNCGNAAGNLRLRVRFSERRYAERAYAASRIRAPHRNRGVNHSHESMTGHIIRQGMAQKPRSTAAPMVACCPCQRSSRRAREKPEALTAG